MFKNLRILVLLCVLLVVAIGAYRDKNQDWSKPVYVMIYPINADDSAATQQYINTLSTHDFAQIDDYIKSEAQKYGQNVRIYYRIGPQVDKKPPPIPRAQSIMNAIKWSLKFRYYAYQHRPKGDIKPSLSLFVQFYDSKTHSVLVHQSTALENGRIGVVNLFADEKKHHSNMVVLAHESLHGFGATDKYDLRTGHAIFPEGYANTTQNPLYPQQKAELMAMHIMQTPNTHKMARTLDKTVIGDKTAREIGWW